MSGGARAAAAVTEERAESRRVLDQVRRIGILPFTHPRAISVVSIVAGQPLAGSWWGHPAGHRIYRVGERLSDSAVLLSVPLVEQHSTFVHRRLWPALLSVARSHRPWQLARLTASERAMWVRVEDRGRFHVQQESGGIPLLARESPGDVARRLERRLLVLGRSVHTSTGRHEKVLESWSKVARERGMTAIPYPRAVSELEAAMDRLIPNGSLPLRRPWQSPG
jgi:hypothetical protein